MVHALWPKTIPHWPSTNPEKETLTSVPNNTFNSSQIMFENELRITHFIKGTPFIHGIFPGYHMNKTKFYSYVKYCTEKENV